MQSGSMRDYSLSGSLLKRGVEDGVFRDDVNIEVVNVYMNKVMDLIKTKDFENINREELKNSVLIPYLIGISTEKGRELIAKNL
jgi:hypothetical protein